MSDTQIFTRSYCGRQMHWYIVGNGFDHPSAAPDVVFDDASFTPLTNGRANHDLVALMEGWNAAKAPACLQQLLDRLLLLYLQHQKAKIAALEDDRILFELSMLDELGCNEVLLASAGDGTASQHACFSIPIKANLSPAAQLLVYLKARHPQPAGSSRSLLAKIPATALPRQQQDEQQQFVLHAAFKVSGDGVVSNAPTLQLQSPLWCSQLLPAVSLPSWDPQTSLLEYVPHLADRLEQHLKDHCPAALLRFELINSLSKLLGGPLEVNMMAKSGSIMGPSSSSNAGAHSTSGGPTSLSSGGASGAPRRVRSCSVAVYLVQCDQQPLLLQLELSQAFPGDPPVLVLQNTRRTGPDSCVTLRDMPWSPRWPVDEMGARLFNFLKQEAATFLAKDLLCL